MEILRSSALYAPPLDKKLDRMLHEFEGANSPLAHLRKDLELFLDAAAGHGLNAPGLEGLNALLHSSEAGSLNAFDYSALHRRLTRAKSSRA